MADLTRLAMWSGPRNLSTAMMRAFGNHPRCAAVWDEPFYAAYLKETGKQHPMRAEILAAQPTDWRAVARACATDPVPEGRFLYQKHMTHHMLPGMDLSWMEGITHVFLIRAPERVVASYAAKHEEVGLDDIGFRQQAELFERVAETRGAPPPVIDAEATRRDPTGVLTRLCAAIGLPMDAGMLRWPAGARDSDGIWARHWYGAVENSTEFAPPDPPPPPLGGAMEGLAEAARPYYDRLRRYAL